MSTLRAKYISLCKAAFELKWIRTYLEELFFTMHYATSPWCVKSVWTNIDENTKQAKKVDLKNQIVKHYVYESLAASGHFYSDKNKSVGSTKSFWTTKARLIQENALRTEFTLIFLTVRRGWRGVGMCTIRGLFHGTLENQIIYDSRIRYFTALWNCIKLEIL